MDEQQIETNKGIPWLSEIPLLGWLFKYKGSKVVKRNLVLFIKPTIILNDAVATGISYSKYSRLRSEQLRLRGGDSFFADSVPVLDNLGVSEDDLEGIIQESLESAKQIVKQDASLSQ